MEEILRESQEFNTSLLETLPNPVVVTNLDTSHQVCQSGPGTADGLFPP